MNRLIVNADDFGYTRGVNRAIVEACRNGVVTSASLLANGAAFEDAVEMIRAGATRLGTSSGVKIVGGETVEGGY